MKQIFTKTLLVLAVSLISIGLFAVKTNALTMSTHDCYNGTTTKVPCTVTISSITVGSYTDNGPGTGLGYIAPGSNVSISWSNVTGATSKINHYEVYSGCSDNTSDIYTYDTHIGNASVSTHSITWQVPSQKYCKIWVYAKDTIYTQLMMNAIGVSNTRFINTISTVTQICAPGTTNYCTTSVGCGGNQTCNSSGSAWGSCIDTPNDNCPNIQVCAPGTTNSCTTSVGCGGNQTCNSSGSAWGSCIDTPNDNCPNTTQVPVVTLTATSPITAGQATNLSWYTSNYPTSCIATSSNSYWTGSKNISSGNESVTIPTAGSYTFTITCSNSAGTGSDTKTVIVNTIYQNITVDLTASPTTITSGQTSNLTWYSANATYCTASGAWSGSKTASGSETVHPTSSNNDYSITCYNNSNQASDNTNVYVTAINNQLPTVTLTANPTNVTTGQTSTLNWSSTNANYCTASGDWSGSKSTSNGSETIYPIKTSNYYTIVCTNNYGSTSASTTVNVTVTTLPPIYSTAAFAKTGRDLSVGDKLYTDNISVNSGDVVEFYLTVNVSSYNGATNIIVTDPLPYNLIYRAGTTKVDGVTVADGITGAGLYLGNLSQGTVKTITFQAVTRAANYGTIVTNTAQLKADNIATLSDGANVDYNRGTVLGAETVDTGPSQVALISLTVALLCTGAVIYAYNKNVKFQALFEGAKAKVVNSKIAHWQL